MASLSQEEFEAAVQAALESIPEGLLGALDNVTIFVQDEPEDWQLDDAEFGIETEDGDLLGLYDGVPLTERGMDYGEWDDYPDAIYVFKGPHERLGETLEKTLEEVRKTTIHEVGHFFGMSEAQLARMGYE